MDDFGTIPLAERMTVADMLLIIPILAIPILAFLLAVFTGLINSTTTDSKAVLLWNNGSTDCPEGERCIVEVLKIHRYGEYYIYSLRTNYNEVVTGILFGQTVLLNEPIEILYTKEDVMLGQAICIKYKNGFVASGDRRFCGW